MDIIVTTPKSEMVAAAREAADARAAGGATEYFRRFPHFQAPRVVPGDRVYYVEDGFVRGFAAVSRVLTSRTGELCETTGRWWEPGFYAFMRADSWRWIRPIPMKGFRGFRYAGRPDVGDGVVRILAGETWRPVLEEGGWLDPRPRSCRICGCTDRFGCPPPRGPCSWVEPDLCSDCRGATP